MHLGLFSLMTQRDRSVSARQLYQELVEQVKLAEAIGFDLAWFAEHHFSNYCLCPSPLALVMALAPRTTRIRLGTARDRYAYAPSPAHAGGDRHAGRD